MSSGFNFWMVVSAGTMCVDNVNVTAMDFSSLPGNVAIIQWREGRGEIEQTTGAPLRTIFQDVTPYCQLFQQFMTRLSGLTLAQAQQIQTDLLSMLYDNKRQLPFSFNVAAGNFSWSTVDADIAAMSIATIPSIIGSGLASLATTVNTIAASAAALQNDINANLMAVQIQTDSGGVFAASPGLFNPLNHSFPTYTAGAAATIKWTPIGHSAPVTLSSSEMAGLMSGISTRSSNLLTTLANKSSAIGALAEIADVIAYDVTTGW